MLQSHAQTVRLNKRVRVRVAHVTVNKLIKLKQALRVESLFRTTIIFVNSLTNKKKAKFTM